LTTIVFTMSTACAVPSAGGRFREHVQQWATSHGHPRVGDRVCVRDVPVLWDQQDTRGWPHSDSAGPCGEGNQEKVRFVDPLMTVFPVICFLTKDYSNSIRGSVDLELWVGKRKANNYLI